MENRKRVLLVEDYQANIMVATALLEDFGYDYDVANNGQEALEKVREQPFNLVLMDVQMPGIDGFEATHFIREWEKEKNAARIPIIGMTAHALAGDRERCLAAGMDDYVPKPFHPDVFKEKLEKYLGAANL